MIAAGGYVAALATRTDGKRTMPPSQPEQQDPRIVRYRAQVLNVTNKPREPGGQSRQGNPVTLNTAGGGHRNLDAGKDFTGQFDLGEIRAMQRKPNEGEAPSLRVIDYWGEDNDGNRIEVEPMRPELAQGDNPATQNSGTNDDTRARRGQEQEAGQTPTNTGEHQPGVTGDFGGEVPAEGGGTGGGGEGGQGGGMGGGMGQGSDAASIAGGGNQGGGGSGTAENNLTVGDLSGQTVEQLRETARGAGVDVKSSWGRDRLISEIEKAQQAG